MPGIEDYFLDGDPTGPGPGKPAGKPSKSSGTGIENYYEDKNSSGSTMSMGRGTNVKLDEYTPYMKGGVNSDFNIDLERAQNQGKLETLGKTLGNTVANVATGMGEMVGYAGSLVSEWGDDRDYSNFLTKQMQALHNPFGEVYLEHPDKVWDMGDSAWWAQNVGQLVESAAAFALPGGEIAKGFEYAAKAASEAMSLGKTAQGVVRGAAQVASAALMGYQEGAMSGYRVYDQAYKTQLQKNLDAGDNYETAKQKAKSVASDAASTTVQMYTKLGAVLNLTAFSPLFKRADDEAYTWLSTEGKRQAGESIEGWKQRVAAAGFDNKDIAKIFAPRHGITGMASEVLQEGGEEFIQNYFDKTGEDIGNGKDKTRTGLETIQDFFDKTMDQEGALNFFLGGLGGGLQTAILDNIPLHRINKFDGANNPIFKLNGTDIAKDKNGKDIIETTLVSSRTRDHNNAKEYFEKVKDAIVKDIDWFQTKNQQMQDTKDPVLKESLRSQMFNVNNLNAVTSGLSDNWKQQYQEVHDLNNTKSLGEQMQPQIDQVTQALQEATQANDPSVPELTKQRQDLLMQQQSLMNTTEAMQKGYAKDMKDNWYKEQARGAIQDLDYLQKTWTETQKKYAQTDEQKTAGLADYIFAHQADLYQNQKILTSAEQEHAKLSAEYDVRHAGLTDDFDILARQYQSDWDSISKERDAYTDDFKKVGTDEMKDKYHGLEIADITKQLTQKINELNQKGHELNENLRQNFEASDWVQKHPGKTYEDYFKALQDKYTDHNDLNTYKAQIEEHRTRTSMLNNKLNELISTKGILNTIKKAQAQKKDLVKELEARNKKDVTEAQLKQRSSEAARKIQATQLTIQERHIKEEIVKIEARIADNMKVLQQTEAKIAEIKRGTGFWKQLNKNVDLDDARQRAKTARYDLAIDRSKLAALQQQLQSTVATRTEVEVTGEAVDTKPPPVEPAEDTAVVPTAEETVTADETNDSVPKDDTPVIDVDHTDPWSEEEKVYRAALEALPENLRNVFNSIEEQFKAGEDFTYQKLLTAVQAIPGATDKVSVVKAVNTAAVAMKNYLQSLATVEPIQETSEDAASEPTPIEQQEYEEPLDEYLPEDNVDQYEITGADLVPEEYKDSPETNNVTMEVMGRLHKGKKATSGLTIANMTLEYVDYQDTKGNYKMVSPEGKLNPNTPEDILKPKALGAGTTVTLRPTEYNGPVNSNTSMNTFKDQKYSDFLDEDGKVIRTEHAVGNVPIGIFDENDNLLGYLPTQSRLSAQYEGAQDLRNMAEGAYEEQVKRNMKLREQITLSGTGTLRIASKGPGSIIQSYQKVSDNEYRRQRKDVKTALPDTSLSLAIVSAGTVYENKKSATTKDISSSADDLKDADKAPVVLLPMANGTHMVSPLFMNPLAEVNKDSIAVNSIMEAIREHLSGTDSEAKKLILDKTGFDLNTPEGLRSYINQFWTYTEKFDATHTIGDGSVAGQKQRFLFNVTNNGDILLGTSNNGNKPMFANKGNLAQFKIALQAGLATRYKNFVYTDQELGIDGINSKGPFNEMRFTGNSWQTIPHQNYNAYIKTHATTFANGTNQLKDSSYVYAANPQIELDESALKVPQEVSATVIPVPNPDTASEVAQTKAPATVEATAEDDDLMESLGFEYSQVTAPVATIIAPSTDLAPISLDNLTELYNFTPSGERNGLTPDQVLDTMIKSGIPYIAEGHNPFIKCN